MDETVTESVTGQGLPKPSREQRDASFSTGAGRKAVEVPKEQQEVESRREVGKHSGAGLKLHPSSRDHKAPVGLELETKAEDQLDHLLSG